MNGLFLSASAALCVKKKTSATALIARPLPAHLIHGLWSPEIAVLDALLKPLAETSHAGISTTMTAEEGIGLRPSLGVARCVRLHAMKQAFCARSHRNAAVIGGLQTQVLVVLVVTLTTASVFFAQSLPGALLINGLLHQASVVPGALKTVILPFALSLKAAHQVNGFMNQVIAVLNVLVTVRVSIASSHLVVLQISG